MSSKAPPIPEAAQAVNNAMSEADFQHWLIQAARALGWMVHHSRTTKTQRRDGSTVYHTPLSGDAGFFDLVLMHQDHGIIFAELKSQRGSMSVDQKAWFNTVHSAQLSRNPTRLVMVRLWRPSDRDRIERILRGEVED